MMNLSHWSLKVGKFSILTSLDGVVFNFDRAETVHVCAKTRSLEEGGLWYRYQLIRYQVPPKLKVLVPPFLWEGAIMNMTNSERRSTSVPRETNEQDQTTPEHVTVASVSLSAL